MRTITKNIYNIHELSEKAQRKAWENNNFMLGDNWSTEFRDILKRFEDIFDIEVYDYSVDDWAFSFRYVIAGDATGAPENDPLRLAKFIWNHYASAIESPRIFSKSYWRDGRYVYKRRNSKIFNSLYASLTGFYADDCILRNVIDCLRYKKQFNSYEELMDACLEEFFEAWRSDIEYCNSFEYFVETAEANQWEFTEGGMYYAG